MSGASILRQVARAPDDAARQCACNAWWDFVVAVSRRAFAGAATSGHKRDDHEKATTDVAWRMAANAEEVLVRLAGDHAPLANCLLHGVGDTATQTSADNVVRRYVHSALKHADIDHWRRRQQAERHEVHPNAEEEGDQLDRYGDHSGPTPDAGLALRDIERLLNLTMDAAARRKGVAAAQSFRGRVDDLLQFARGEIDMETLVAREADPPPPPPRSARWMRTRDTILRAEARTRDDLSDAVDLLEVTGALQSEDALVARQVLLALRRNRRGEK